MGGFERPQSDALDDRGHQFDHIVGNSPALELVLAEVKRVAPTDSTVSPMPFTISAPAADAPS